MKRSINIYWYEHEPLAIRQIESSENSVPSERVLLKPDYPVSSPEVIIPTQSTPIQSEVSVTQLVPYSKNTLKLEAVSEPKTPAKNSTRFYKKPLPDNTDEWLAQKIYRTTGNLQEIEARQLVDKYGHKAVGQALGRMEYMSEKGELQNPVGFMKVVSRVCWLAINGFEVQRPKYQSSKKRKSRKPAYSPKQDPIWQSEVYRTWRLSFKAATIDIWEFPQVETPIEF
jgi:hypothetical protein